MGVIIADFVFSLFLRVGSILYELVWLEHCTWTRLLRFWAFYWLFISYRLYF